MASSNARHGRNGVRGVGRLFKWVVVGRPMERKSMEAWALQGDGGFSQGADGACEMGSGSGGI